MPIDRSKLLERAENTQRESRYVDFKREFDVESKGAWCEVIKDIVAFANSGGGVLIFGLSNDGSSSGIDVTSVLSIDIADITNKLQKFTGCQFSEIEIIEVERGREKYPAFFISGVNTPLVFTKSGIYTIEERDKTAFIQGAVYFRHGGKSEPANQEDLIKWRDEALEKARKAWLGGIRKVVETPANHSITVVSSPRDSSNSATQHLNGMAITATISAAPGAVRFTPQNAEEIWPYRQIDLLKAINEELKKTPSVNGYDILCINKSLDVLGKHPEFAYKPHKLASPQYSKAYADWIVSQYKQDSKFLLRLRSEYKGRR